VASTGRFRGFLRRCLAGFGFVVLGASFVVGADMFSSREALFGSATGSARAAATSRDGAFTSIASKAPARTVLRSQPWWQEVASFDSSSGSGTPAFTIDEDAIQWRVRWTCDSGRFVVRRAAKSEPLIDAPCSGSSTRTLTTKPGPNLRIEAGGDYTARVEQQVDVPLIEPPLPAMSAPGTRRVARGSFYRIDQVGRGTVTVYRLADGRYALRLADFYVTANIDLEIRLHPLRRPRTSRDYTSAPARLAAPLYTTVGSMNFVMPRGVDPTRYRSVVIWCPTIVSAYAAATLERTGA
jgi:hypothetical protein